MIACCGSGIIIDPMTGPRGGRCRPGLPDLLNRFPQLYSTVTSKATADYYPNRIMDYLYSYSGGSVQTQTCINPNTVQKRH